MFTTQGGIDLAVLKELKEAKRARLSEYIKFKPSAKYVSVSEYPEGKNGVWDVPCDGAFPCATQNEPHLANVKTLYANGCRFVAEKKRGGRRICQARLMR